MARPKTDYQRGVIQVPSGDPEITELWRLLALLRHDHAELEQRVRKLENPDDDGPPQTPQ